MIGFTIFTFFISVLIIKFSNIKNNGLFFPPVLFSILIILGFVIPIPFIIFFGDLNPFFIFWPHEYNDFENSIVKAEFAAILANVFFFIGFRSIYNYDTNSEILFLKNGFRSNPYISELYIFLILIISLLSAFFAFFRVGGISNYFAGNENRVEAMSGFNIFSLIQNSFAGIFLYWYFIKQKEKIKFQKISFFILATFLLFLSNSKSPIFVLFFSLIIFYYYFKKRISNSSVLIGSLLFMFIFIFWELFFREYMVAGEVVTFKDDLSFSQNLIMKFGNFFLGNFMQVQTVSIIMDSYPAKHSFIYGSSFLMIILIWIPRAIFPNKPLTAAGDFTISLWPEAFYRNGTTLPPGLIGELYMNFSWVGIIIGIFLIGRFYGFLWKKLAYSKNDFFYSVTAVIFVSLMLHFFRGELSAPLLSGIFFIIPGIIFKKIYKNIQ